MLIGEVELVCQLEVNLHGGHRAIKLRGGLTNTLVAAFCGRSHNLLSPEVDPILVRCCLDDDPFLFRVGASWTKTLYVPSGCLRER